MTETKTKQKNRERRNTRNMYLCNKECDEDRSNLSLDAWERMKVKAQEWKGLRKFGTIYDSVDWEAGPKGVFFSIGAAEQHWLFSVGFRKLNDIKKLNKNK